MYLFEDSDWDNDRLYCTNEEKFFKAYFPLSLCCSKMSMFDMSKKVLTYNIFPCYTHHQASVVQLGLHKQRFTY